MPRPRMLLTLSLLILAPVLGCAPSGNPAGGVSPSASPLVQPTAVPSQAPSAAPQPTASPTAATPGAPSPAPSLAPATISTVAGRVISGFDGDGRPATETSLNRPAGLAFDSDGLLYIADSANNRIRRRTSAFNLVTVAGGPDTGFAGDNGSAAAAVFSRPIAVAVDGGGNLYIADWGNRRVRKVDATTGKVATYAGNGNSSGVFANGTATAVSLTNPYALVVDGAGNLYIADSGNSAIRKVDSNGILTTVAGTGTGGFSGDGGPAQKAQLRQPRGLAIDKDGNLYIADSGNHRIRKVAAATGVITTLAGTGNSGFGGDNGPATAANVSEPYGVAVDGQGNVYITEPTTYRVRRLDAASGTITTVAGNGQAYYTGGLYPLGDDGPGPQATLAGPTGITVDAAGDVYFSDVGPGSIEHRVRKLTFPR